MPKKNYYLILGVSPNTSAEKIRSAFRRLAKKHHPDRTGGKETSPFIEITEAYETLSDPEKRKGYNQKLEEEKKLKKKMARKTHPSNTSTSGQSEARGTKSNTRSIFDYLKCYGTFSFQDIFFGRYDQKGLHSSNTLEFDVFLTPNEAVRGESLEVDIPASNFSICPQCMGKGGDYDSDCLECGGKAASRFSERFRIDLPAGIQHGEILRARVIHPREKNLHLIIHVHIISPDY